MQTFETLKGRVALVTGGASGMGKATALRLGSVGMKVVIADFDEENAGKVVEEIKANGGNAIAVKCDVTDEESVKAVMEKIVEVYGKLNSLVHCAGVGSAVAPIHEIELKDFERIININLKGTFLMMKYGAETMLKTKAESCSIVNISSVSGVAASSGASSYTAAKFGVVGLTKNGAVDYAKHGITVNAICPYVVRTGFLKGVSDDMIDAYVATCANGRLCEPDEVAGLALFLISDMARYISGTAILSDAGKTAGDILPIPWKEI